MKKLRLKSIIFLDTRSMQSNDNWPCLHEMNNKTREGSLRRESCVFMGCSSIFRQPFIWKHGYDEFLYFDLMNTPLASIFIHTKLMSQSISRNWFRNNCGKAKNWSFETEKFTPCFLFPWNDVQNATISVLFSSFEHSLLPFLVLLCFFLYFFSVSSTCTCVAFSHSLSTSASISQ